MGGEKLAENLDAILQERRDFFVELGKWSAVVIGSIVLPTIELTIADAAKPRTSDSSTPRKRALSGEGKLQSKTTAPVDRKRQPQCVGPVDRKRQPECVGPVDRKRQPQCVGPVDRKPQPLCVGPVDKKRQL